MGTVYELPATDGRKSNYGKAVVVSTPEGLYLRSYDTIVCGYHRDTGSFHRYWSGYSATTQKHINCFLDHLSLHRMGKKEWELMPVEKLPIDMALYRPTKGFTEFWGKADYA